VAGSCANDDLTNQAKEKCAATALRKNATAASSGWNQANKL